MKPTVKLVLAVLIGCMMSLSATAQKFGYVDSGMILEGLPQVKEAESNLEALGKQLQAKGQKMMEDFQIKYQDLEKRVREGDITPKEQETQVAALKEEETKIMQYEQDMQAQLAAKRDELLAPILEQVRTAIKDVAKEGGYSYVFDGSPGVGVLLYADETTNLTDMVKKKLGVQ
jgi:outer membrane protein